MNRLNVWTPFYVKKKRKKKKEVMFGFKFSTLPRFISNKQNNMPFNSLSCLIVTHNMYLVQGLRTLIHIVHNLGI